jgi:hypothetical protein
MKLRVVSTVFATNVDGGRYLFTDEVNAILESYRADLARAWRRFKVRETHERAAEIATLEGRLHYWRELAGKRGRCPCYACNLPICNTGDQQ